jgi:nucleotide-binding universal stress UspA family protein
VATLETENKTLTISIRKILLATDFSEASVGALPYARAVAAHHDSEVYVVNVAGSGIFPVLAAKDQERILAESQLMMRPFLQSALAEGPRWKSLIKGGDAAQVIGELARELKVDLLVLGTNGRRGLKRFVLGSVAEEIFRVVPCPVLTIGPKARRQVPQETRLSNVLFATDMTATSLDALPLASQLAQTYSTTLTVLHVVRVNKDIESAQSRLAAMLQEVPLGAVQVEPLVRAGAPAETILNVAAEKKTELIVLGVRHGGSWDRAATHAPGPVAYDVVAQASCPVLTLRSQRTVV